MRPIWSGQKCPRIGRKKFNHNCLPGRSPSAWAEMIFAQAQRSSLSKNFNHNCLPEPKLRWSLLRHRDHFWAVDDLWCCADSSFANQQNCWLDSNLDSRLINSNPPRPSELPYSNPSWLLGTNVTITMFLVYLHSLTALKNLIQSAGAYRPTLHASPLSALMPLLHFARLRACDAIPRCATSLSAPQDCIRGNAHPEARKAPLPSIAPGLWERRRSLASRLHFPTRWLSITGCTFANRRCTNGPSCPAGFSTLNSKFSNGWEGFRLIVLSCFWVLFVWNQWL